MLGHLKTSPCEVSPLTNQNYWLSYCSLCASLRTQHATPYALLLSNEITLLLMAFENYITNTATTTTNCPAKAFLKTKPIHTHYVTKIASDISVVLAWIKIIDSITDKPALFKKAILRVLTKKVNTITSLSDELQNTIQTYIDLVKKDEANFDTMQHHSGQLAYQIALEIGQKTSAPPEFISYQAETFRLLGEIIGLADHLIDFTKDLYEQQYNPIIDLAKINQSSFLLEYTKLFDHFCYKRNLVILRSKEQTSPIFREAVQQALLKLSKKIDQTAPDFIKEKEQKLTYKFVVQRADCDCGGCDCNCDGCSCDSGSDNSCCFDTCSSCDSCSCCDCGDCCNCCSSEQGKKKSPKK